MKKTYTKKQISEAIAYWQKQLREINESAGGETYTVVLKNLHAVREVRHFIRSRLLSLNVSKAIKLIQTVS